MSKTIITGQDPDLDAVVEDDGEFVRIELSLAGYHQLGPLRIRLAVTDDFALALAQALQMAVLDNAIQSQSRALAQLDSQTQPHGGG